MTRVEALEIAIGLANGQDEVVEKLEGIKAQLSKKRTSTSPTKKQRENEVIKDKIFAILSESENKLRASDIVKLADEKYSLPKVTAMLKQLVESGKVEKVIEKKIPYFSVA